MKQTGGLLNSNITMINMLKDLMENVDNIQE